MALPVEFWRSDQMVNVFRTRPCKRLMRDGYCEWGSQCQFSHNLSWPRRQPQKHRYTPELCPHVQLALSSAGGAEVRVEEACAAGLRCTRAHSTEEALYHPRLLKTVLCEEHAALEVAQQGPLGRAAGRRPGARCHRYYCPFAHGEQELRPSSLSPRQRERCVQAVRALGRGRGGCCEVCDLPRLGHGGEQDGVDGQWGAQNGANGQWGAQEPDLAAQEPGQGAHCPPQVQGGMMQQQGSAPLVAFRPFPMGDFVGYGGATSPESRELVPASPEQCQPVLLSPMPCSPLGAVFLPLPAQGGAPGCDMAGAACHAAAQPFPSPGSPAASSSGGLEQHRGISAQTSPGCAGPWRQQGAQAGPAGAAACVAAPAAAGVPMQAVLFDGYGQWTPVPAPWGQVGVQQALMQPGGQVGQAAAIFVPQLPFSPAQPLPVPHHGSGSPQPCPPLQEPLEPWLQTPPPYRMERLTTPSDDGFEPWATPPRRAAAAARWPGAPAAEVK